MLAVLPRFRVQGSGRLATVRSMTAFLPSVASASYAAAKPALRAFHHAVAIEERDGATAFTIIHPSATEAPMLEQEAREEAAAMAFVRDPTDPAAVAGIVLKAIRARRLDVYVPANHGRRFGDLAAIRACCGKWWRRMRASAAADSSSAARVRSGWPEVGLHRVIGGSLVHQKSLHRIRRLKKFGTNRAAFPRYIGPQRPNCPTRGTPGKKPSSF